MWTELSHTGVLFQLSEFDIKPLSQESLDKWFNYFSSFQGKDITFWVEFFCYLTNVKLQLWNLRRFAKKAHAYTLLYSWMCSRIHTLGRLHGQVIHTEWQCSVGAISTFCCYGFLLGFRMLTLPPLRSVYSVFYLWNLKSISETHILICVEFLFLSFFLLMLA